MAAPVAKARPQNPQNGNAQAQQVHAIPFTRCARRKSQQAWSESYALQAASTVGARPIEVPAAGFLRYLELIIDVASAGNNATVALPGATLQSPWNVINSLQVTNAAGDSIMVPMSGYMLYLINKYGANRESPQSDPRSDPEFSAPTTGSGATAGSFRFRLLIPFEQDPRDAFCALPNLAANKAYQVVIQWGAVNSVFAGGTAPNGTATLNLTMYAHYWSQPQPTNSEGLPQETEPRGNGSVSLYRLQSDTVSAGNRVMQLYNVGNVIRWGAFMLRASTTNNPRTDTDFPAISYLRLNNDQLFIKSRTAWEAEMHDRYGFGGSGVSKDTAGGLDTGVYVLSDFMSQHGFVTVDGPRDQYLVTLDSTLFQYEASNFGANAQQFDYLQNEIKPKDALSLYNLNVV